MKIADNKAVGIHYTLTDDDGVTIDTSRQSGEPLVYLHGFGSIITGLETALAGREVGDTLKVSVEPEDAYGVREDSLLQEVPRDAFGDAEVEAGMQFQAQTDEGVRLITVVDVQGDTVTVDGNHPLAGLRLHFDVEVTSVRDASEEELAHGHVHGPGGHHHH